jgi:hypothetical protein
VLELAKAVKGPRHLRERIMKMMICAAVWFLCGCSAACAYADTHLEPPQNGAELLPIVNSMAFPSTTKDGASKSHDDLVALMWTAAFISGAVQAIHAQASIDKRDVSCMDMTKVSDRTVAMGMVVVINKYPQLKTEPPIAAVWITVTTQYPCLLHPAKK